MIINVHNFKRQFSKSKAFQLCFLNPWWSEHINNIVEILILFLIILSKQHNVNSDFLFFLIYSH